MSEAARPSSICHTCKRDLLGALRPGEGRHQGWAYDLRQGVLVVQCRRWACRAWCAMPDELFERLWDHAVYTLDGFAGADLPLQIALCARREELSALAADAARAPAQETP